MSPSTFRQALLDARAPVGDLLKAGLSPDQAAEFRLSLELHERDIVENFDLGDEDLSALFSLYDPANIEVGMVRFAGQPQEAPHGWTLGRVEADDLVFDQASGEVIATAMGRPGHVLWRCAASGGQFLGALAEAAGYLEKCVAVDQHGTPLQASTLNACVSAAGGSPFASFYEMLLCVE